jgi:uncharacterized protein YecT (DUF1311 family)
MLSARIDDGFPLGDHMKAHSRLLAAICLASLAGGLGCRKDPKAKTVAGVGQDTMLMHDLAEANRNTAAASALDNSLNTVRTSGGTVSSGGAAAQNRPADTKVVPRPSPNGSQVLTSGPRLTVPTTASDAPAPTTVSTDLSPANGSQRTPRDSQRSARDPCDSPTAVNQRSCLNRSIAANDADLNRTYQELIAQAQKSGGSELQDRFQQSQRDWINQRDNDCTGQTPSENGKLWARARARCLADYSAKRTAELQRNLNNLRGQ